MSAVMIDWNAAETRLKDKLASALKKREAAEFAYRQAEQELETLKAKRRAAEGR